MKTTAFLEQAKREAQLVDALLVARYALVIHDGMTLLKASSKSALRSAEDVPADECAG